MGWPVEKLTVWQTIKRSLIEAGPVQWLSLLIGIMGIPAAVFALVDRTPETSQLLVTGWALLLGSSAFLGTIFFQRRFYAFRDQLTVYEVEEDRRRRMHNGFESLHDAFDILRDTSYQLMQQSLEDGRLAKTQEAWFASQLQRSLGKFAEFFELHTGSKCRAVIKTLERLGDDDATVTTLSRSHGEGVRPEFNSVPLNLNSDFLSIINGGRRYFFSKDLRTETDYRNPTWGNPPRYLSTIVWPIRVRDGVTLGFLGIDSPEANVFDESEHVFLGAAFADTLFSAMSLLATLQEALTNSGGDDNDNDNDDT